MQEPKRISLLDVVIKSLAVANRKTFIHRTIYLVKFPSSCTEQWFKVVDLDIKRINENRWDDSLAGLGLFFPGYIVNILEGTEDLLDKHITKMVKTFKADKMASEISMKILAMIPHISKRYFVSWRGVNGKPPVLLDALPKSKEPDQNAAKAKECILKLYRLSDFLSQQSEDQYRVILANITKSCKAHLPEVALLDYLIESPFLLTGDEYVVRQTTVPSCPFYHELVWPSPPDFVPRDVLESSNT